MVEQLALNQLVVGSNPSLGTTEKCAPKPETRLGAFFLVGWGGAEGCFWMPLKRVKVCELRGINYAAL